MKVVFCTPTRSKPHPAYIAALEASVPLVESAGWEHAAVFETGSTYISWARANLARRALTEGSADVIVFLDDDLSWSPDALVRLLDTADDAVAGLYRFKKEPETYMGALPDAPDDRPLVRADGAIAAWFVPAGFLKLTRAAVQRIAQQHPELRFGGDGLDLFQHGAHEGLWYGEDYAFSRRWRSLGGELWIVPDLDLTHHHGERAFPGNFHRFMCRQPGGSDCGA